MHEFGPHADRDAPVFVLGDATLDLRRGELRRGDSVLHLRPRTFDVLVYLVRHAGRLVAKQELMDAVWGDVAVTDDSLVQCLVEIRKSLGEDSVTTQRGRGYRFERPVRPAEGEEAARLSAAAEPVSAGPVPDGANESPRPPPSGSAPSHRWKRSTLVRAGAAGIAALAIGLVAFTGRARRDGPPVVATIGESTNAEARREVAVAETFRRRQSRVGMAESLKHFERAAALDPQYAAAHVGIARLLTAASVFGAVRPADVGPRAKRAALRAIELAPTMSEAHVALAHSQVQHEWDWRGAEASYRKAIALDPSNVSAHRLFGLLLGTLGRFEEALAQNSLGLSQPNGRQVVPRSSLRGILFYWARQPEGAIHELQSAIAAEPDLSLPHFWLALVYAEAGRLEEAMHSALESREAMGNQPTWVVGYVHARAGRRAEALTVLRALETQAQQSYVPAADMAFLHVGLGDRAAALTWLERGVTERSHWMELLAVHPVVDPIRGEPRFQALLRTLALPTVPLARPDRPPAP